MRASQGEIKIYEILTEANMWFEEEKSFPGLIASSGRPLRLSI